jgi:OmpA family
MRALILGCSLLALAAPVAQAQQTDLPATSSSGAVATAPGTYQVFFGFDEAQLTADAQDVVAQAAQAYRTDGSATIMVTGHTDTVGSSAYNQNLSERRAEAVAVELVRQGVPQTAITTVGRGEQDLLVPTGDEVREAQNRRVEIQLPEPPAPPVMAEPVAPAEPAPVPEEEEPGRFTFTVGGVYGHNFGETDGTDGGDKTENDLAGLQLTFDALPAFLGGLSLKQSILGSFNGVDDGLVGRTVASLNLMPLNLVVFRPFLSANFGGVYGEGVQDGLVAGPEIGFDISPFGATTLRTSVAYDYQFRNAGWDEGILWGGVSLGYRF